MKDFKEKVKSTSGKIELELVPDGSGIRVIDYKKMNPTSQTITSIDSIEGNGDELIIWGWEELNDGDQVIPFAYKAKDAEAMANRLNEALELK